MDQEKGQEPNTETPKVDPEAEPKTFDAAYVKELREENAKARVKLKQIEEEGEKRKTEEAAKRGEFETLYTDAAAKLAQYQPQVEKYQATLTSYYEAEIADISEDLQALIPDMPIEDKLSWVKTAKAKGVFGAKEPLKGPPPAAPGQNETTQPMTSTQMIAAGLRKL